MDHTGLRQRRGKIIEQKIEKRKTVLLLGTCNVSLHVEYVLDKIIPFIDAIYFIDVGSKDSTVSTIKKYMADYDIPIRFDLVQMDPISVLTVFNEYRDRFYKNLIGFCDSLDWDIALTKAIVFSDLKLYRIPILYVKLYKCDICQIIPEDLEKILSSLYNIPTVMYRTIEYSLPGTI